MKDIFEKFGVEFAYQFGSTVIGGENVESDVDIAVFLPADLSKIERFDKRLLLIEELGKYFGKSVDVVVLNDVSSLFFKYVIISEGKLVYSDENENYADFACRVMGLYFDFKPFLEMYNKNYVEKSLQ